MPQLSMMKIFEKLENPDRPLLGPNVKILEFLGLLLPKSLYKKSFYMLTFVMACVFSVTECLDVWFVKADIDLLLNNLKITMLATITICKGLTFLYWQQYWVEIIEYVTKADLNQRATENVKKNELISKFTMYCRKITYLYSCLVFMTVIIVITQPIYKFASSKTYRDNVKNGTETYLQVVSTWVPFDKNSIPGYIVASIYQTYGAIHGGSMIISYDTNAVVIMVFFRAELELLRIDCANIFSQVNMIEEETFIKKLKLYHMRHIELVRITRIFDSCLSPIMLLYMCVCSVMLCITAYQITIETNPMQRLFICEYLIFGVSQLFIYCWHSNDVLFASEELMRGPYESKWWNHGVRYRKDLILLASQFRTNILFSAGPFTKLTLATFLSILKGAYSYYTLLSQSQMT